MEVQLDVVLSEFERDYTRLSPSELLKAMNSVKIHVTTKLSAERSAVSATKWCGAYALVVAKATRQVLHQLPTDARRQQKGLEDLIFTMEDAIMTVYHILLSSAGWNQAQPTPLAIEHSSASSDVEPALLHGAFTRIAAFSIKSPKVFAVWTDIALLLSLCWLHHDAKSLTHRAVHLLEAIVSKCREQPEVERFAAWPLFALGVIERQDGERALGFMREAVALMTRQEDGDDDGDGGFKDGMGVVHYWYAVLMSSHKELHLAAMEQLRLAVRCNYHVVASLNLHALLALQRGDLYEASEALERSIGVDFDQVISMFNYAVLLKQMGNYEAQYQMLGYYTEASSSSTEPSAAPEKNSHSHAPKSLVETETHETDAAAHLQLFTNDQMDQLFPVGSRQVVARKTVTLESAVAAMACGWWHDARVHFEKYFDQGILGGWDRERHAVHSYIYVLLQCNRPTEALQWCEQASRKAPLATDLTVAFYKADALLCLERVEDSDCHLRDVIEPKIRKLLDESSARGESDSERDQFVQLHIQLLNNFAIAAVCGGDVERGVSLLRECLALYKNVLSVKFNLTMLLWRLGRREAACTVWFEAREWSLRMDVGDMREQQKALDFVSRVEDEALCSAVGHRISTHVNDHATQSGDVDDHQLRYLDALILNHWGNAQGSHIAKTAADYAEYLESLSAHVADSRSN